ncbi:hypothetical protein VNO78_08825 [Psophocarpus tetragonolobus]|uniref:Uncharacterized protein n=1 Tax=Psophocarpus tetragonolobus TaxID=3891 RepID=A0AAN9SVF7_PSOTE
MDQSKEEMESKKETGQLKKDVDQAYVESVEDPTMSEKGENEGESLEVREETSLPQDGAIGDERVVSKPTRVIRQSAKVNGFVVFSAVTGTMNSSSNEIMTRLKTQKVRGSTSQDESSN